MKQKGMNLMCLHAFESLGSCPLGSAMQFASGGEVALTPSMRGDAFLHCIRSLCGHPHSGVGALPMAVSFTLGTRNMLIMEIRPKQIALFYFISVDATLL